MSLPSSVSADPAAVSLIQAVLEQDDRVLAEHFFGTGMATPTHEWDPPDASPPTPELRELLRYWRTLHEGERLPRQSAFDILEIPRAVGFVMLLDVLGGGEDFYYRVYGTGIAQDTGFDMTGKRLSSVPTMAPLAAYFMASYRAAIARRASLLAYHQPPPGQPIRRWARLILPMIDENQIVSRILVGNMPSQDV
jgi:hypothetical protein